MRFDGKWRLKSSAWKKTWFPVVLTTSLFSTTCSCLTHSLCLRKSKDNKKKSFDVLAFDLDTLSESSVLFFSHTISHSQSMRVLLNPSANFPYIDWNISWFFFPHDSACLDHKVWLISAFLVGQKAWEKVFHLICILGSDYVAKVKNPVSAYCLKSN